jgi:hypothetical protein
VAANHGDLVHIHLDLGAIHSSAFHPTGHQYLFQRPVHTKPASKPTSQCGDSNSLLLAL